MASRPLLWSPAHPAAIDADGRFHRLWCPDLEEGPTRPATRVSPSQALMWEDAPKVCLTCRSEWASGRAVHDEDEGGS